MHISQDSIQNTDCCKTVHCCEEHGVYSGVIAVHEISFANKQIKLSLLFIDDLCY